MEKKTKKLDVEFVIRKLINKTLEMGKRPLEIRLTQAHYDELCNKLHDPEPNTFEVIPDGIVFHEYLSLRRIGKYMDLPVNIGAETRIIFY